MKQTIKTLIISLAAELVSTATAWAETTLNNINYIDANGNTQTASQVTVVSTGMQGSDNGQFKSQVLGNWLYVQSSVTLENASNYGTNGVANLILGDGATLTINGKLKFQNGMSLNIYCQSGGTGKLVINGQEDGAVLSMANYSTLTINGGTVEVTNTSSSSSGLSCNTLVMNGGTATFTGGDSTGHGIDANVTFNGGKLTATGGSNGLNGIYENTTINWKNATDRIKANSYGGNVTIADGKYAKDASGNAYGGTLTNAQKSAIANVELQPATEDEYATCLSANYYTVNLPDGVTASGEHTTYNTVDYYAPGTIVTLSGGTIPTGYAVSGYKVDGTPIGGTSFAINTNAIVTIVKEPIEYSITYHENGGTMPNAYPTTYNIESADITLPTPARDGYTFGGWYINDGLTGDAVTTITTGAYGAKQFWAKWTANTYTVAFDKNNNDATGTMDNQNFTYDEAAKALAANAFERTGYTFSGWNTETDGSGNAYTNQQKVQNLTTEQDATVTLYAQWTLTPYAITYHVNDGTMPGTYPTTYNIESADITLPTPTRDGYTFGGWYINDGLTGDAVTTITTGAYGAKQFWAKWTAITYTVAFDKNGGSGDAMDNQDFTYDAYQNLTANTYTAPTNNIFGGWNTKADGSGISFDDKEWVGNLTTENGATVTLYAQWKKNLGSCTANVPNPIYHSYSYHGYFYDGSWNDNHGGIEVYDGETLLTYGTDYYFSMLESLDGGSCEALGEHCRVHLVGMGNYAGEKTADVVIVPSTVTDAQWGDLTWNLDAEGKFTITGKGAMKAADTFRNYDWYNYSEYFTSISIGNGITTVAAAAFGGDSNTNPYASVTSVSLPTTLTTIGEKAFAYCTGVTFNADELIAQGVTIGEDAFNQVGCIVGTLQDNADNTTMLSMMASAATADVTITGRTLYKDGDWNTICLPFDVKKDNSLLTDATVKELDLFGYYGADGTRYPYYNANYKQTGLDNESGTLYLYFKDAKADSDGNLLRAGVPYLIKWPSGKNITADLTFEDVKVFFSPSTLTSEDKNVSFNGTFSPLSWGAEDKSILLVGTGNSLYWPKPSGGDNPSLGAFRAYFQLSGGASVRELNMNFGEGNGDATRLNDSVKMLNDKEAAAWYTLDGRKLNGQPTTKGLYIHGGRKVVVP